MERKHDREKRVQVLESPPDLFWPGPSPQALLRVALHLHNLIQWPNHPLLHPPECEATLPSLQSPFLPPPKRPLPPRRRTLHIQPPNLDLPTYHHLHNPPSERHQPDHYHPHQKQRRDDRRSFHTANCERTPNSGDCRGNGRACLSPCPLPW